MNTGTMWERYIVGAAPEQQVIGLGLGLGLGLLALTLTLTLTLTLSTSRRPRRPSSLSPT